MTNTPANDADMNSGWPRVWVGIERRRVELGWSKAELAARTGLSATTFRKMREGANP